MAKKHKYTAEETYENRRKWFKTLRTGRYKQCAGMLKDQGAYCCLGVACQIALREKVVKFKPNSENFYDPENPDDCSKSFLPKAMVEWLGAKHNDPQINISLKHWKDLQEFKSFIGSVSCVDNEFRTSASSLNDTYDLSFKQIAAILEKYEKQWARMPKRKAK